MKRLHILFVIGLIFAVSATTIALAQSETPTSLTTCPERSSTYQNGVLIYQCEIVERGGIYSVVESDSKGLIRERPATQIEVSTYLAITRERECMVNKRLAKDVLSTPVASNADLNALTVRITAIEAAIRECS